jgi:CO/xanthine dehydrogenase FAD-binding subunit
MVKFGYHAPTSLEEAIDLLSRYGEAARPLAGGTALLVDMKHGYAHIRPTHLVSLTKLPELDRISRRDGGWSMGSLTTLTAVEAHDAFAGGALLGLVEATRVLGGRQIRNMGTVGGNICHASPGADMVPPLLCLDAELQLTGAEGERTVPLDGFLLGPDHTAIRPAEILTEIRIPPPAPRSGSTFLKVMRRHSMDCSIVSVAARITSADDGETCAAARIAIGAAAPVPFRATDAENLLYNERPREELIREVAERAVKAARPITDVRASAEYRRMLVRGLVGRAVTEAWNRARSESQEAKL